MLLPVLLLAAKASAQFEVPGAENFMALVSRVVQFVAALALVLCVVNAILGSVAMSKGDPNGKERVIQSGIAVTIILGIWGIVYFLVGAKEEAGLPGAEELLH